MKDNASLHKIASNLVGINSFKIQFWVKYCFNFIFNQICIKIYHGFHGNRSWNAKFYCFILILLCYPGNMTLFWCLIWLQIKPWLVRNSNGRDSHSQTLIVMGYVQKKRPTTSILGLASYNDALPPAWSYISSKRMPQLTARSLSSRCMINYTSVHIYCMAMRVYLKNSNTLYIH